MTPGVMLSCELPPDELIRLARLSEDLGYDELWYTDQRFWRDCYAGLTAVALQTERIRIGPGVNDPFTRHPAMIAMAIATLDELSDGRAILGLGVGGSGIAQLKLPKERPVRALREAIEIVRLMLTGEAVDYEGEIFSLAGVKLGMSPVRREIPISVATHGEQVLRLCGRMADGVLLGNMAHPEAIEHAVSHVRQGQEAGSRRPEDTVINLRLEAIIAEDRDAAFSVMRKRMAHRLVASYPNWSYLGDQAERLDSRIRDLASSADKDGVALLLTDDDVRSTALVGDPPEVAAQLSGLLTADVGKVTIRPYAAGDQGQDTTVRLFAEAVWPVISRRACTLR